MSSKANMFQGLSMLRSEERKRAQASGQQQNSAMQEYLKRYAEGGGAADSSQPTEKKKRKKKQVPAVTGGAIKIIDEDADRAIQPRRPPTSFSDDEENDGYQPVIANEAEAKLFERQAQKAKEYYKPAADGSGWVSATAGAHPARHDSPGESPPRRAAHRHDSSDSDASPPRRRGARHDSPDASPPRKRAARHDSPDASPPRRAAARHDSPDASPPRRAAVRHDSSDASPPRRPARHDNPDASPPRRKAATHDTLDASPPRHEIKREAASPVPSRPPERARHDSPDASPPRRAAARHDSPDASPPRRRTNGRSEDASPRRRNGEPDMGRKMMADGTATGLVSAKQLKEETDKFRQDAEARRLQAAGRNAQTVYRDKATGKVVSKEEFQEARSKGKKPAKTKEEEEAELYLAWRGGLAQRRAAEEVAARLAKEAAAPFARYENDRDRDELLKSRVHFGDPMAHLVRQGHTGTDLADITQRYDATALQQSGFIIPQGIPSHSWLKRGVAAPGNRYNIRPGRHWDGVDRSNGFEKKMFDYQATVRHREKEAREWSMADM